jgi:hypothetical protein
VTLANLIKKRDPGRIAMAIPAIPATEQRQTNETVAGIATVAVANPKQTQTDKSSIVGAGNTTNTSRHWLIHCLDRAPLEVTCIPNMTRTDILRRYPAAIAVQPFEPIHHKPITPMGATEEVTITSWLEHIGETDQATIAEVLSQCQRNGDVRAYFIRRAEARFCIGAHPTRDQSEGHNDAT